MLMPYKQTVIHALQGGSVQLELHCELSALQVLMLTRCKLIEIHELLDGLVLMELVHALNALKALMRIHYRPVVMPVLWAG